MPSRRVARSAMANFRLVDALGPVRGRYVRRWMMVAEPAADGRGASSALAFAHSVLPLRSCCASPVRRPLPCRLNLYAVAQMFAGPRAAGTWVGVQNAIGNVSGIVGPIVTGIVMQRAGYNSAFYLDRRGCRIRRNLVGNRNSAHPASNSEGLTLTTKRAFHGCTILNHGESERARSTLFFVLR